MRPVIEPPPSLTGGEQERMQSLYAYLFRLSQSLNLALDGVDSPAAAGQLTPSPEAAFGGPSQGAPQEQSEYSALRSLIISTAQTVRREMDQLETVLKGETEAISGQFGSFKESLETTITATARDVVQSYRYEAAIGALNRENDQLQVHRRKTEGFIRSGFIDYDADGVPIVGIAIGQDLSSQPVTENGRELEQFDPAQSCTFYTADKVSFRMQGREIAYVSNRKLYIGDVQITGAAQLGRWRMEGGAGLTIQWIGGM